MVDDVFSILGKLAAAIFGLAVAIYGWQKLLRRDGREEVDATLLGRGKQTIFEQYEGIIARLEADVARQRQQMERVLDDQTTMRTMLTQANARIMEIERDRDVLRKIVRDLTEELLALKRHKITVDDLRETGVYEAHLHQ